MRSLVEQHQRVPPDFSAALSSGGEQHAQPCWRMIRVANAPNRLRLTSVLQSFRPELVVFPPRHGPQQLQIRMVRPRRIYYCRLHLSLQGEWPARLWRRLLQQTLMRALASRAGGGPSVSPGGARAQEAHVAQAFRRDLPEWPLCRR